MTSVTSVTSAPFDTWHLVLLHAAAASHGAVCLDGSPPGYYIERGLSDRWMLHLQGGGWCTSLADCASRAKNPLGSSRTYAADRDEVLAGYDGGAHGLFSNSSTVNPDFHNYTKVYIRYCDGGSFSGDAVASTADGPLYFRGRRILDAVLDDLKQQGLSGELFVNGCSAGGLAVWLHLDYIAARLSGVRVLGIPECGFFMDLPTVGGQAKWTPLYKQVAAMQNATSPAGNLDADCLAAWPSEAWRCFMAQYTLPHVTTPFFAVNSVYDSWQGVNILGLNSNCVSHDPAACSVKETAAFNGLRSAMLSNLSRSAKAYYTYNCATHCGQFNHDERWNMLDDGDFTLRERFTQWAKLGEDHHTDGATGWGPAASATCTGALPAAEKVRPRRYDWSQWPQPVESEVKMIESE